MRFQSDVLLRAVYLPDGYIVLLVRCFDSLQLAVGKAVLIDP